MNLIQLSTAGPFKSREYLIRDILPIGFPCMLYGAPKTGKSVFSAWLASHVAIGKTCLDREVKQAPVIYADFELTLQETYGRFLRIAQGLGLDEVPDNIWYLPAAENGLFLSEVLQILQGECENTGAKLIVVDSLSIAQGLDATDFKETIRTIRSFNWLSEMGVCLLFLDHQGKLQQGESYTMKTAWGPMFKQALCRIILQLKMKESPRGNLLTARWEANNFSTMKDETLSLLVDFGDGDEGIITFSSTTFQGRILEILKEHPMLRKELARIVGNQGLTSALKRLSSKGLIGEVDGKWMLCI